MWLGAVAGLLAIAFIPAGCERGGGAERVRLELWTLALRPTFVDYMNRVCADFEATHPGVDVVWVDVPFNAINRKLVAAAASGQAPDVVNLSDRDFARFASMGALAPLDEHLPADPASVYLPGTVRVLRLGDQQLALPWYLTTSVMFVNTAMLEAGGLSAPEVATDWEGIRRQARQYHATTGGFLYTLPLGESSSLPIMLLASGIPPFAAGEDGRLRAELTRGEVVAFVDEWVTLYRDGVLPRSAATRDHQGAVELYQNGGVAIIESGANMLNRIADANPRVFEHTVVRPGLTGSLGRAHVAVMTVAVTKQSDHPALATELAWHLTSAANQLRLAQQSSVMPSNADALGAPFFRQPDPDDKVAGARALAATALDSSVPFTPALESWPDLRRAFDEGIKQALLEGRDTAEVLAEVEDQWNRILAAGRAAKMDAVPRPAAYDGEGER